MRRKAFVLLMAGMVPFVIAACGGGGGGGYLPPAAQPLAAGTFARQVNTTPYATYVDVFNDVNNPGPYYRTQNLYTANTIGAAGRVTGMSLLYYSPVAAPVTCPTVTIRMGHTVRTGLTVTFGDNHSNGKGGLTTVLSGTVTIPDGAVGDWVRIDFAKPFDYNGVDNLIVDIERSSLCSGTFREWVAPLQPSGTSVLQTWNSPTGFLQTWLPITKFHFSGGEETLQFGGSENSVATPFGNEMRFQGVYLASEITGTGPVTGLGFKTYATTTTGNYTYTLKLGHTTRYQLSTTFAENYSGTPVTVVSNGMFTIPAGVPANTCIWLPFPGTFIYNGRDNLLIDLDMAHASATNPMVYTSGVGTARAVGGKAGVIDASDGVLHLALRFHGGPIAAGLGANGASGQVFEGDGNGAQIQSLYHAAELGTGGAIKSIRLRLLNDSNAATHSGYTVKMGHTARSVLSGSDPYADNMDENATVHTGSFSIPAGLKAGDWITIPLSSPFTYDPTKNLAVFFSTAGGAGVSNDVRWYSSSTRYPARVVGSEDGFSGAPSWTDDGILEIMFDLQ